MVLSHVKLDLPRENGFGKPSWLKNVEQEYKACTDGVAVVDLTSLGLLEVEVRKRDKNRCRHSSDYFR